MDNLFERKPNHQWVRETLTWWNKYVMLLALSRSKSTHIYISECPGLTHHPKKRKRAVKNPDRILSRTNARAVLTRSKTPATTTFGTITTSEDCQHDRSSVTPQDLGLEDTKTHGVMPIFESPEPLTIINVVRFLFTIHNIFSDLQLEVITQLLGGTVYTKSCRLGTPFSLMSFPPLCPLPELFTLSLKLSLD